MSRAATTTPGESSSGNASSTQSVWLRCVVDATTYAEAEALVLDTVKLDLPGAQIFVERGSAHAGPRGRQ